MVRLARPTLLSIPVLLLIPSLLIPACGGDAGLNTSTAVGDVDGSGGDGEDTQTTTGPDSGDECWEQPTVCADLIECLAVVLPDEDVSSIAPGGSCWCGTEAEAMACLQLCIDQANAAAAAYPNVEACGGDSSGDGDGDPTTGDGDGDPTTGDGDGDGDPNPGVIGFAESFDMAFDGAGVMTVVHVKKSDNNYMALRFVNGQWLSELVFDPWGPNTSGRPGLGRDSQGVLHTVFRTTMANSDHLPHLARRINNNWTVEELDESFIPPAWNGDPEWYDIYDVVVDPDGAVYALMTSDLYWKGRIYRWDGVEFHHLQATSSPHALATGRLSIDPNGQVTAIAVQQMVNAWIGAIFTYGSLDYPINYAIESKLELGAGISGFSWPGGARVIGDLAYAGLLKGKDVGYQVTGVNGTTQFAKFTIDTDHLYLRAFAISDDGDIAALYQTREDGETLNHLYLLTGKVDGEFEWTHTYSYTGGVRAWDVEFPPNGGPAQYCLLRDSTEELVCSHP